MTPKGMAVLLAVQPVDMRRSFDGLARAVQEQLGRDARTDRAMFVFVNRRRDLLKLLWRDATGWCLLAKRLDKHVVALPHDIPSGASSIAVDAAILAALLDGVVRVRKDSGKSVARDARAALSRHESKKSRNSSTGEPIIIGDEHHRRPPR
jgi:transposase